MAAVYENEDLVGGCQGWNQPFESRFGPKRGFGVTPGELLTVSKPHPYPVFEKFPARKGFTKPNL